MMISPLIALVTALLLLQYVVFGAMVGMARGKHQVPAPQVSGNPDFERVYRVQMNTLENLVIVLPAMWLFGVLISAPWAAGLGLAFFLGRILYAMGYYKAAEKRSAGFGIGYLATIALVLGVLIKSVMLML